MPILICRHGETIFNHDEIFQGYVDSPLTKNGVARAKRLRSFIQTRGNPDTWYLSPSPRVRKTFELVSAGLEPVSEIIPELQEVCYGAWEGVEKKSLKGLKEWGIRSKNRFQYIYPENYYGTQGQSYEQLHNRLIPFWGKLSLLNQYSIVIAHLGVMLSAKKYFLNLSSEQINEYRPSSDTLQYIDAGEYSEISY